ncbi:MAG: shikimate dehydrogenase [Lachnospiraceae bacterium]|nr:shikimate dehydrogenase [Lachnospiraceae bacterium]
MNNTITGHTGLMCLLGSPCKHSISPMMHNKSFEALGLDYRYLAFEVDEDTLETAVSGLKALGARGFNLTMPCKNKMVSLCDHLSPAAKLIGAVNTVVNDNGILTGHNTDGIGYMQSVKDAGFDIIGKKMVLLGAGGAATAILVQAALDGVKEISVFLRPTSRFYDRALATAKELRKETGCKINLCDFNDQDLLRAELSNSTIVVNGTSIGMAPNVDACPVPDASFLPDGIIVSDIIYNPKETKLLAMAREKGLPHFNGTYMLLYQGAEAFRLWTGCDMPVPLIKESFFAD